MHKRYGAQRMRSDGIAVRIRHDVGVAVVCREEYLTAGFKNCRNDFSYA